MFTYRHGDDPLDRSVTMRQIVEHLGHHLSLNQLSLSQCWFEIPGDGQYQKLKFKASASLNPNPSHLFSTVHVCL